MMRGPVSNSILKGIMSWNFLKKQCIDSHKNNPSQSSLMTH